MTKLDDDRGFTLVEALVSLLVFSLIAAGAVLMLTQSVRTQESVNEAQAALREVQNVRTALAGDAAQFVPRETRAPNGARRPPMIGGDADAPLAFVRAAADPVDAAGAPTRLAFVEYGFENGGIVRRMSADLDAASDAPSAERILVRDAGEPRFEFFDGTSWREQWIVGHRGASAPRAIALVFRSRRYGEMRVEVLVGVGA